MSELDGATPAHPMARALGMLAADMLSTFAFLFLFPLATKTVLVAAQYWTIRTLFRRRLRVERANQALAA